MFGKGKRNRPEEESPPNACGLDPEGESSVTLAAGFLDVSEFRVLEIAYPFWFGRAAEPEVIARAFDEYLERGTIPFWTRAFIRALTQRTEQSGCAVEIIEVRPPELSPWQKGEGVAIMVLLALFLGVFCYVIAGYPSY